MGEPFLIHIPDHGNVFQSPSRPTMGKGKKGQVIKVFALVLLP